MIHRNVLLLRTWFTHAAARQRIARASQEIAGAAVRAINQRVLLFDFLP
jgi:hypothetical protein